MGCWLIYGIKTMKWQSALAFILAFLLGIIVLITVDQVFRSGSCFGILFGIFLRSADRVFRPSLHSGIFRWHFFFLRSVDLAFDLALRSSIFRWHFFS